MLWNILLFWRRRITYRVTEFFGPGRTGETVRYGSQTVSKRQFNKDLAYFIRSFADGATGGAQIEIFENDQWREYTTIG